MLQKPLDNLKPLAGYKVVTIAINIPGPVASARLRDLGARVTKIEPPSGDPLAHGCPAWYGMLHENVEIVRLDLKDRSEHERLFVHLEMADLLLTSLRPISLERIGFAWDALHTQFPRLCHVAIIGHSPPDENRPGHDLTYQARIGLVEPPALPRSLLADLGGAQEAVSAALALLLARERGQGAKAAYVSLAESAQHFATPRDYGLTSEGGVLGGGWPGYNFYKAADGWIAIAALETHFVERLVRELGVESLTHLHLARTFCNRTADEWERWAATRDLPIVAVQAKPRDRKAWNGKIGQ